MSLFNEAELRDIIRDEVRTAIRQEMGKKPATAGDYLSIAEAAEITSLAPQTIRRWVRMGRLTEYKAGRVLRVRRSELETLLAPSPDKDSADSLSPEALAERDFHRIEASKGRCDSSSTQARPRARVARQRTLVSVSQGADPASTTHPLR
jgi:excisionase family DNA binding protein